MVTKTVTNSGLNTVRDALASAGSDLVVGTDTTPPSVTDTTLGAQVVSKSTTTADVGTGKEEFSARLLTTDANGDDLAEVGLEDSSGDLLTRLVFAALSKTSDFELEIQITAEVSNP